MLASKIKQPNLSDTLPTHKTCSKCHQSKLLCDFYKNKDGKFGVKSICKTCESKNCKKWYDNNKEKKASDCRTYQKANREKYRKLNRDWRKNNRERYLESRRVWLENNRERQARNVKLWAEVNKERVYENRKAWRHANVDKCRSYQSKRRAIKKLAFPLWARTGEIKAQIDAIYREAKDLELFHGESYHVDHIHPLQSYFVCGLHVPANLRPLVGKENFTKNNSFIPYIENSNEIEIDMVELRKMVDQFLGSKSE